MSSSRRPPSNESRGSHVRAVGNYGSLARKHAPNRDVEAQALLKAARRMQELQNGWDKRTGNSVEEILKFNRQLWVIFYDNAVSQSASGNTKAINSNIISLAGFVFKRSMDILAEPDRDKLSILISINREIAAGLMTKPV